MTKILERAIEEAKRLPTERQDEVGEILLALIEQDASGARLSPEQEAEVRHRLATPQVHVPQQAMKTFFRTLAE